MFQFELRRVISMIYLFKLTTINNGSQVIYKSKYIPVLNHAILLWLPYLFVIIKKRKKLPRKALREKCPNMELFLVRIQSEYRKIWTRNNSVFGHFSYSEGFGLVSLIPLLPVKTILIQT